MCKVITMNGQEYEFRITARKVVGNSSIGPLDEDEVDGLIDEIKRDIETAVEAIDYAVDERYNEAGCTCDEEDRDSIAECAKGWSKLMERLRALL